MFLRGDIWRAVAIKRLQAPTLLSLIDSRPAKTKASVQSTRPNIILRAFRCTDSINSSRYKGIAAQTGEAYSTMDLTILQQTNTRSLVPSPTLLRVRSTTKKACFLPQHGRTIFVWYYVVLFVLPLSHNTGFLWHGILIKPGNKLFEIKRIPSGASSKTFLGVCSFCHELFMSVNHLHSIFLISEK